MNCRRFISLSQWKNGLEAVARVLINNVAAACRKKYKVVSSLYCSIYFIRLDSILYLFINFHMNLDKHLVSTLVEFEGSLSVRNRKSQCW